MVINFGNNFFFDVVRNARPEKPAKSIDFAGAPVTFRKVKQPAKVKRKIGSVWVLTKKPSFAFLMSCFILKRGMKKAAGFYSIGNGKYIFMEFVLGVSEITSNWTQIDETPEDYLSIEGKQYDFIFGNSEIKNIDIDFDALYKELLQRFSSSQVRMVVMGAAVLGVVGIGLWAYFAYTKPKAASSNIPPPPPPLTEREQRILENVVMKNMYDEYNKNVESVGPERVMTEAMAAVSIEPLAVKGKLVVKYKSFYPFDNSAKDGDWYVWLKESGVEKKREDIPAGFKLKDPKECLGIFLQNKAEVITRKDNKWQIRLETTDYHRFIKTLNSAYGCPLSFRTLTAKPDKQLTEVMLDYGTL